MTHSTRRTILGTTIAAAGAAMFAKADAKTEKVFPFTLTDAEWRARLNPEAHRVLRGHGTERAGTSPLDREKRAGTFVCAGCEHKLFDSATKFDSGTGWPSFTRPVEDDNVGAREDVSHGMRRIEVVCTACGGHLGHVFPDGPGPSGLRYCINSCSLTREETPA
jgi:peptide-methionine (R)-S-oxide reductase